MKEINLKKIKTIITLVIFIILILIMLPFLKTKKHKTTISNEKKLITSPLRLTPPQSVLNIKEDKSENNIQDNITINDYYYETKKTEDENKDIKSETITNDKNLEKDEKIVKESFLINVQTKKNNNKTLLSSYDYKKETQESLFKNNIDFTSLTNSYNSQNNQKEKQEFIKNNNYKVHNLNENKKTFLPPGIIIPITLINSINSDLPGIVWAQISQNIYRDNGDLLLKKGEKVLGEYNSIVSYAQNRLQVKFNKIVKNTGEIIETNLIGCDRNGTSGFIGYTNDYKGNKIGASLISSLSGIGTNLLSNAINNTFINSLLSVSNSTFSGYASKLLEKEVDRQPTITVEKGTLCYMLAI